MPSGDAMSGAIFGIFLFDIAPYHGWLAKAAAILVIPLICLERVVLGYHTVAQVTVGSCMGIALHYYSTRAPQFMIFVDGIIQIIGGAILLQTDSSLVYELDSMSRYFILQFTKVKRQFVLLVRLGSELPNLCLYGNVSWGDINSLTNYIVVDIISLNRIFARLDTACSI